MDTGLKPLVFRLPKGVSWQKGGGSLHLLRRVPLGAVSLDLSWEPVFEKLSNHDFVSINTLLSLAPCGGPRQVERFLNGLSLKGFLEQEGFSCPSQYPFVSVIIPVRNRPLEIEACLRSLERVVYPRERLEIVVVDDASSDSTPEVVSEFPVRLVRLREKRQASYCRNLGANQARGEILAFIDSDCVADPLWLVELVTAFRDPSVGVVGGIVDSCFVKTPLDRYEQVKSSLIVSRRARRSRKGERFFYVPSCNLLAKRDPFLNLGGFREDLTVGEDVDLCWRMQDAGWHVEFRPAGRVFHRHRNRVRDFCSRRFDYGTSEPLLQRLHPGRTKQMAFPPGAFLFWGMIILGLVSGWFPLLGLSGVTVVVDALRKLFGARNRGLDLAFAAVLMAVARSYATFFYHCCAFVSRYYLFWAFLLLPLFPTVTAVILCMHLLAGTVEYLIKRPGLNPAGFLFYFSLEQVSYQLGVWRGCLRCLSFSPVNPRLLWGTSPQEG